MFADVYTGSGSRAARARVVWREPMPRARHRRGRLHFAALNNDSAAAPAHIDQVVASWRSRGVALRVDDQLTLLDDAVVLPVSVGDEREYREWRDANAFDGLSEPTSLSDEARHIAAADFDVIVCHDAWNGDALHHYVQLAADMASKSTKSTLIAVFLNSDDKVILELKRKCIFFKKKNLVLL